MPRKITSPRGGSVHTYSGKRIFPLDLKEADIDIVDIAHHLAMICRYGGATSQHYSVAQHCVLMSEIVNPENSKQALLHDAPEYVLGDIVRPLKNTDSFGKGYRRYEEKVWKVIAKKYDLDPFLSEDVEEADLRICTNELRDLLGVEQKRPVAIPDLTIVPMLPAEAEQDFLNRASELGLLVEDARDNVRNILSK